MSQSPRRPALGRGLSALIPGADSASASAATSRSPLTLPLDQIHPAPHRAACRMGVVNRASATSAPASSLRTRWGPIV